MNNEVALLMNNVVRSGTSIGANINEANYGQSKADFISKMHIALGSNCRAVSKIMLANIT